MVTVEKIHHRLLISTWASHVDLGPDDANVSKYCIHNPSDLSSWWVPLSPIWLSTGSATDHGCGCPQKMLVDPGLLHEVLITKAHKLHTWSSRWRVDVKWASSRKNWMMGRKTCVRFLNSKFDRDLVYMFSNILIEIGSPERIRDSWLSYYLTRVSCVQNFTTDEGRGAQQRSHTEYLKKPSHCKSLEPRGINYLQKL